MSLTHQNFMNIAHEISLASKCVSKKVGAIIVKDGRILSTGYNGTPVGFKNCCDVFHNGKTSDHYQWSKKYEIHAEMNAIIWAAREGIMIKNATIYVTLEPCAECSKNIIASGISHIIYDKSYRHNDGSEITDFIQDNGITIQQINY